MTRQEKRRKAIINRMVTRLVLILVLLLGVVIWLMARSDEQKDPVTEPTLATVAQEETTTATEPPTEAELPSETEPDLSGIPESLLELMERNPETTEFVLNYPYRQELGFDLSAVNREAGVPLFLQWDMRWGYTIYGTDVMALTGCGPTCMAMAGYYLTGDEKFTPNQMTKFAEESGYYAWGNGTAWSFFADGAEELGLQSKELTLMKSSIVDQLEKGRLVVLVVGPGDFTEHGHYLLVVGYEDGMFRINDPNSIIRSETLWSYERLEPQIRNLWAIWA